MNLLGKLKDKTVADMVDTAKEKAGEAVKAVAEDKGKTILTLLPIAATMFLIFGGHNESKGNDIPTKQVINNYYYYSERQVKKNAADNHKSNC